MGGAGLGGKKFADMKKKGDMAMKGAKMGKDMGVKPADMAKMGSKMGKFMK